jgi:hypothetical protein
MLLLRLAIVLFIILLFLPSSAEEKQRVYSGISHAVQNVQTFCVRNARLCDDVGSIASAIADRAYYGALIVYDAALGPQQRAQDRRPSYPSRSEHRSRRDDARNRTRPTRSTDTLRREDRATQWRGPDAS